MTKRVHPYWGVDQRRLHPGLIIPGNHVQQSDRTSKILCQLVLRANPGDAQGTTCTIRLLNTTDKLIYQ
eukprot:775551-Ditylum_brightwellii.AAC.1